MIQKGEVGCLFDEVEHFRSSLLYDGSIYAHSASFTYTHRSLVLLPVPTSSSFAIPSPSSASSRSIHLYSLQQA